MLCLKHKKGFTTTWQLRACKNCGKKSDKDPKTFLYCRACSKKLRRCRYCGKKL